MTPSNKALGGDTSYAYCFLLYHWHLGTSQSLASNPHQIMLPQDTVWGAWTVGKYRMWRTNGCGQGCWMWDSGIQRYSNTQGNSHCWYMLAIYCLSGLIFGSGLSWVGYAWFKICYILNVYAAFVPALSMPWITWSHLSYGGIFRTLWVQVQSLSSHVRMHKASHIQFRALSINCSSLCIRQAKWTSLEYWREEPHSLLHPNRFETAKESTLWVGWTEGKRGSDNASFQNAMQKMCKCKLLMLGKVEGNRQRGRPNIDSI